MERVVCSCANCNAYLGEFFNQWVKIGKSYISPLIEGDRISSVTLTGEVRLGDKETLVENCHLQDLACNCNEVIGLKCLDTPVNHVLCDGQLFLRFSSIHIKNLHTRKLVELKIQRTLKLREASHGGSTTAKTPPASENSANMSRDHDGPSEIHGHLLDHHQAQIDSQREETQRLNRAGFQMAFSFDNAVLRIEGEIKKLKDGMIDLKEEQEANSTKIGSVDNDVTRLRIIVDDAKNTSQDKSAYTRLDEELASAKQVIADVRTSLIQELNYSTNSQQVKHEALTEGLDDTKRDLGILWDDLDETKKTMNKRISTDSEHSKEIASLRAELKELKEELAKELSQKLTPKEPVFPSREIDILTTNVTKIGQRAGQIDALRMEFEILRERVQRMDKGPTFNNQDVSDVGDHNRHSINSLPEAPRRKRKHSPQPEETANLPVSPIPSASKRLTRKSWTNSPSSKNDSSFSSPSAKAQASETQTPNSPRLTKSGAVDKRSMRRLTRLATLQNAASND
ncbi:hypothetical protein F4805DRAFT_186398 [Annulohypoxylon moriforme]|nr:hypothetical protein F4805DRAFT_186398 [Annulohypoxylon moriforme]